MKNYTLLLITFIAFMNSYSQEVYFLTGTNFAKYNFKGSNETMSTKLQSGTGSNFEIGYYFPLNNDKFSYSAGITLNDFNALAGSISNNYQWNTKYLGAQTNFKYTYFVLNEIQIALKGGLNLSKIIYGKQNINGSIYDLVNQKEFSGVLYSYFFGLHANYKFNDLGYLSIGYGFLNSLNASNNMQEKVTFNTQQIQFGIHFNINKK
jgi:hypothetical protein